MEAFRQRTSASFIVVEVENKVPSVFQATKLTVTQSFVTGCSVPLPGWSTFIARPEGITCASGGAAATSAGAVITRPVRVISADPFALTWARVLAVAKEIAIKQTTRPVEQSTDLVISVARGAGFLDRSR